MGRTKSYEMAKTGNFPCTVRRLGRNYRVVKADLLRALGIDQDNQPASVA